ECVSRPPIRKMHFRNRRRRDSNHPADTRAADRSETVRTTVSGGCCTPPATTARRPREADGDGAWNCPGNRDSGKGGREAISEVGARTVGQSRLRGQPLLNRRILPKNLSTKKPVDNYGFCSRMSFVSRAHTETEGSQPMPRPRLSTPTEGELEILKVLWERGPLTVREVLTELNAARVRAYTSVMSLMNIMTDKGLLHREPQGRA